MAPWDFIIDHGFFEGLLSNWLMIMDNHSCPGDFPQKHSNPCKSSMVMVIVRTHDSSINIHDRKLHVLLTILNPQWTIGT